MAETQTSVCIVGGGPAGLLLGLLLAKRGVDVRVLDQRRDGRSGRAPHEPCAARGHAWPQEHNHGR